MPTAETPRDLCLRRRPIRRFIFAEMECVRQIEGVQEKLREHKDLGRPTIFTSLLTGEDKPGGYKIPTTWPLKDEAYSILVAAADTTGNATTVAAFNVLYNQSIYLKLVAELEQKFPGPGQRLSFVDWSVCHTW